MPRKKRKATKPRGKRGLGTIFPDNRRGGLIGRVPAGRLPSGRTRYVEVRADTHDALVEKMRTAKPPGPDTTVGQWADRWLASLAVRPSTLCDYTTTVTTHIKPTLGGLRIASLTAHDVQTAVNRWKLGANTANKNLRTLRAMLEAARRAKLVTENVAKDAHGPKSHRTVIRPFPPADLARIVAACLTRDRSLFALLATAGCRIGEALALDIADFNPAASTVSITKTYCEEFGTRAPKSENGRRTLRVAAQAIPALVAAVAGRKSGPLFTTRTGARRKHPSASTLWGNILKELKLPHRNIHQLRHSVATALTGAHVPVGDIARDLGDSVQTIVTTYLHPTGIDTTAVMEGLLEGSLGGCKVAAPVAFLAQSKKNRPPERKR